MQSLFAVTCEAAKHALSFKANWLFFYTMYLHSYINYSCVLVVYMPGATFIAPGFVLYIFTNVGIYSFVVPAGINVTMDVLIVAGGGGGGGGAGTYPGIFKNGSFLLITLLNIKVAVVARAHCLVILVK